MIRSIAILGAGTAGLVAALTLRIKLPQLRVRVIRSPDIGVIGVGEGTNVTFPQHLFEYLKIPIARFHALADPTWKLGIRFLWGPRPEFIYSFAVEYAARYQGLARPNAAYVEDDDLWIGPVYALMAYDKAFGRDASGQPQWHRNYAFHIENVKLVAGLETLC